MSDITARLRAMCVTLKIKHLSPETCLEAAEYIEQLEDRIKQLKGELESWNLPEIDATTDCSELTDLTHISIDEE